MRLFVQVVALVLVFAGPVAAQDLQFSPQVSLDCISSGQPVEGCVGASAEACVYANGYATVVESACYSLEADWWDARLNAIYNDALPSLREQDQAEGGGAPSRADALRDMQRAWIAYRDATCSFEASLWGNGTGAGTAYNACLMRETAAQALYLQNGGNN